jgi:hypothetical protein
MFSSGSSADFSPAQASAAPKHGPAQSVGGPQNCVNLEKVEALLAAIPNSEAHLDMVDITGAEKLNKCDSAQLLQDDVQANQNPSAFLFTSNEAKATVKVKQVGSHPGQTPCSIGALVDIPVGLGKDAVYEQYHVIAPGKGLAATELRLAPVDAKKHSMLILDLDAKNNKMKITRRIERLSNGHILTGSNVDVVQELSWGPSGKVAAVAPEAHLGVMETNFPATLLPGCLADAAKLAGDKSSSATTKPSTTQPSTTQPSLPASGNTAAGAK